MVLKRGIGYLVLVALLATLSVAVAAAPTGTGAVQPAELRVNGSPATGGGVVVDGVPFVAERALRAEASGVKVEVTKENEVVLTQGTVSVRVKPGAAAMSVNGKAVALHTRAISYHGGVYLPAEVLQAIYPGYEVSLRKGPAAGSSATVLMSIAPKGAAGGPTCGPTTGGEGVPTQEFGKKGAALEIVALLPITHGCHVNTEAELKKAYQRHPNDIHLIIADLFGSDAPKYLPQTGGGQGAVVAINGKASFTLNGQQVTLRRQEGDLYEPSQIAPIIENALKGAGAPAAAPEQSGTSA